MKYILEFNDEGLIRPGIHECGINELYETFVENFKTSQRRDIIFKSLIKFLQQLISHYDLQEVWIDGSYVTNKINPNDVDIVLFFEVSDYIRLRQQWEHIRNFTYIDPYCEAIVNDDSENKLSPSDFSFITNRRNYWRGQFGFDRTDKPKGIVVLKKANIIDYMNGGGLYVDGSN